MRIGSFFLVLVTALVLPWPIAAQDGTGRPNSYYGVEPLFPVWGHSYRGNFKGPSGIFYDRFNNELYVADTYNNMVGIFNREGRSLFNFGHNGELKEPRSVAVDREGTIYVSDLEGIKRFTYRGELIGMFEPPGLEEKVTQAIMTVDGAGNFYFLDTRNHRVLVVSPEGKVLVRFGSKGTGSGQFMAPSGITVDGSGTIYITDGRATPVQIFDSAGKFVRGFGRHEPGPAGFSFPAGLAVNGNGLLYIPDGLRQDIKVFDSKGNFIDRFGGYGRGPGAVAYPTGIVTDGNGRLFVVEKVGRRVQAFAEIGYGERPRAPDRVGTREEDGLNLPLPDLSTGKEVKKDER